MTSEFVEINVSGKLIKAKVGETIVHAIWAAGMAKIIQVGCVGGVCGACTVTLRFKDDRPGGTDLACLRPVEEGMEVFPYPVEHAPSSKPVRDPDREKLKAAFPTLDRCTKCGSCTTACPMSIPVMDSVLRMQEGQLDAVSEDYITCIHCGLCRFVCEDKVKPHTMGMWVRRSLGISQDYPYLDQRMVSDKSDRAKLEWEYLLTDDPAERLKRAKAFREKGELLS